MTQYHQESAHDQPLLVMGTIMSIMILLFPWLMQQLRIGDPLTQPTNTVSDSFYEEALTTGWDAAVAVQEAQSRQDWEEIVAQWDDAINLLKASRNSTVDSQAEISSKLTEYVRNREYALAQSELSQPSFHWQEVNTGNGERAYFLVAPEDHSFSYVYPGPPLEVGPSYALENLSYVNAVLDTLDLPPLSSAQLVPNGPPQVLSSDYRAVDYPLGEMLLSRTQCGDVYALQDQYECFWKITIREGRR